MAENGKDFDPPILMEEKTPTTKTTQKYSLWRKPEELWIMQEEKLVSHNQFSFKPT